MRMKTPRNWTKHDTMAADIGGLLIKIIVVLVVLIAIIV